MAENLADLKSFLERLSKIEIEGLGEIPKFYLPDWPEETKVKFKLGRRKYTYIRQSRKTDLYELAKGWRKITVDIYGCGKVVFSIEYFNCEPERYYSDARDRLDRASALLMFCRFKEEIFRKAIKIIEGDVKKQKKAKAMVRKAFEPFIPGLAAEKLSKS